MQNCYLSYFVPKLVLTHYPSLPYVFTIFLGLPIILDILGDYNIGPTL
jgi:hypothetical protein